VPYQVACVEGLMHGLYLLWWTQEKQLSPVTVAGIIAAGDLAILLLEIPTGWLADRFGHRASLLTGSLIQIAGMLLCWLGVGVPGLLAGCLCIALGDCFRSGADQALLYRTCAALAREEDFQRLEARAHAAQTVGLVALIVLGGVVVTRWGFAAGWMAETALCGVGFVLAWLMTEPPADADIDDPDDATAAPLTTLRRRIGGLVLLIVPAALVGSAASATSFHAQTALADPWWTSVFVAVVAAAEAGGASAAARVRFVSGLSWQVSLAMAAAVLLGLSWLVPIVFLPVVAALAMLDGFATPLRAAAIQRLAVPGERAQAASLANALDMGLSALVLPLSARLKRRKN
jgi:MFS family permease